MSCPASATAVAVPRAPIAAALATLTLLCATSCSAEPAGQPGPAGSTPPSTSPIPPRATPDEVAPRTTAGAAYNTRRTAQVAASAKADTTGSDLAKYAAGALLSELKYDLVLKKQQGLVTKGEPTWNVEVTKVNVAKRPFSATLEDCFDATEWKTVFKDTGKSAAVPGQNKKYLVRAQAVQYDDGRWLISSAKADRDRPC